MHLSRSVRGNSVRADIPLTDDQIFAVAPSIFTVDRSEERSHRYTQIPTIQVITALREQGFAPFMAAQTLTRDENRRAFARHMVRMRHASQTLDGEASELVLLNSGDGSSAYQMMAGRFRSVCTNSLITGSVSTDIRVRHSGDVIGNVIEGAYTVVKGFDEIDELRNEMAGTLLSVDESRAYARTALSLKYDPGEAPIKEDSLLTPYRYEDRKSDLYTTFNVVQESLIRAGRVGLNAKTGKRVTTRGVSSIQESTRLNRALWELTKAMLQIKTGACVD